MKKVDVDKLQSHELNQKIYGDEEISQDFLDSIDEFGILVPLKVKPDNTIISGHRRWKGAKKLGLDKVPVETITFSSKLAEREAILTYNKQRDKTYSQKMKEAGEWEDIEEEKAKERQEKLGKSHGKDPSGQLSQRGRSKDKIAQKVKMGSGRTYDRAKTVWDEAKKGDEVAKKQVEKIDKGKESIHGAYKKIKNKERTEKIKSNKKDNVRKFKTKNFNDIHSLYDEEFQNVDIDNNSIDHIITDPPYGQDFFNLWEDLATFADNKLKENGFLITYAGNIHIPKYHQFLGQKLDYYWTLALIHNGPNQRISYTAVQSGYKPILVYQKPPMNKPKTDVSDIVQGSGREKDHHKWQQGLDELSQIIKDFTEPNDLICDPMAGSGTTIIASIKNNRRAMGIEKQDKHFQAMKDRLMEYKKSE